MRQSAEESQKLCILQHPTPKSNIVRFNSMRMKGALRLAVAARCRDGGLAALQLRGAGPWVVVPLGTAMQGYALLWFIATREES